MQGPMSTTTRKPRRRNRRIATDELRAMRLERIRERIANGLYEVDPRHLAEKLLDEPGLAESFTSPRQVGMAEPEQASVALRPRDKRADDD